MSGAQKLTKNKLKKLKQPSFFYLHSNFLLCIFCLTDKTVIKLFNLNSLVSKGKKGPSLYKKKFIN